MGNPAIGEEWQLTPQRVAIHIPTRTAVAADLHLGYAQARRQSGEAIPLVRLEEALAPLRALLATEHVQKLVIAGDLFENGLDDEVLSELLSWLAELKVELAGLVPGNHDRNLRAHRLLPLYPEGFELAGWRVVHGDTELPETPVVLGHWHPCLRLHGRQAVPCYLSSPNQLLLPAFSAEAAGVNVLHSERWQNHRCHVIAGQRVLDFGRLAHLRKHQQPDPGAR